MSKKVIPVIILFVIFFLSYATLGVVRHLHFGSYAFDLGIVDQVVWKYSVFQAPITTIQFYPFTSLLTDHVELVYVFLAPLYWIYRSPVMLIVFQAFIVSSAVFPIYLLASRRNIHPAVIYALIAGYGLFYGVQQAIWFDVHSLAIAAGFLAWFIYFLDCNILWGGVVVWALAVFCKEDIALLTFFVSVVYVVQTKKKLPLIFAVASILYLLFVFGVYFPHLTSDGYRYAPQGGFFQSIHFFNSINTEAKKQIIIYSVASFGFLPLLAPLSLLPAVADLAHYFVLASAITGAASLFMHYRITLAFLLVWSSIIAISKYKWLNTIYLAIYVIVWALFFQYYLHSPLSYLTKSWFWQEPQSAQSIRQVIAHLGQGDSIVAQNNIVPHIAHRDMIFTLWPEIRDGKQWFRWAGNPSYLLVDTSTDWDIRHLLIDREDFLSGIKNMEEAEYIVPVYSAGSTTLYRMQEAL